MAFCEIALRLGAFGWRKTYDRYRFFEYDPPRNPEQPQSFRKPVSTAPKGDEFRIVVLGDSYSWGDKIARDEDIWPSILEAELNRDAGVERKVRVINLSMMGLTTYNQLTILGRIALPLEPDIVILQFFLNDALLSKDNLARVGEDWVFPTGNIVPSRLIHDFLLERSYFYSLINDRYVKLQMKFKYKEGYRALYQDRNAGWRQCRFALNAICDLPRQKGIPLYVVIFPDFVPGVKTRAEYPYIDIHETVASICRKEGVRILDLVDAYLAAGDDLSSWWALALDKHPGPAAHKLAAGEVKRLLVKNRPLARPEEVEVAP